MFADQKSKKMKMQYEVILNNLDMKRGRIVMLTHVVYFMQRIVLVVVTVRWNHKPLFQIFSLIITDMLSTVIQAEV